MYFFRCLYWCLLLCNLEFYQTANTCAFFTLNKYPVVIKDLTATLSFQVNNTCNDGNTAIKNARITLQGDSPPYLAICFITFVKGVCDVSTGCTCDRQTHEYTVSRHFDGEQIENETWELSGQLLNGHRFQRMIQMNTTYPPVILEMVLESNGTLVEDNGLVDKNALIQILCSWSEGFPFEGAVMKKDGVVLTTSEASLSDRHPLGAHHSTYTITQAGCKDSGQYSCEAEGASDRKSAVLLVRCAPQFNVLAPAFKFGSSETMLQFPVHVYTEEIVDCRLRKLGRLPSRAEIVDCGSMISWSGKPPELTLTILLTNVTSQLAGEWRLELENTMGTGTVNFSIVFTGTSIVPFLLTRSDTEPKEATTAGAKESDNPGDSNFQFFILLGAMGCIFLVVIILATVFGILYKRIARRTGRPFPLLPPVPHGLRRRLPEDIVLQDVLRTVRKTGSTESFLAAEGNIYFEIDDNGRQATAKQNEVSLDKSYSSDSFALNETLTTIAIASSDSTVSDGYLHPVPDSALDSCQPEGNHQLAAPSVPEASGDPVASSSQYNYLHPVAFKPKTTTEGK